VGSLNLAARARRWSAAHWMTATALWLVFVLAAVVLGCPSAFSGATSSGG